MKALQDKSLLIGRILVGLFYLMTGFGHFSDLSTTAGYAASKGVPAASLAVVATGVLLLVAALSILTGFKPKIAILVLLVFYVPVTVMMHSFWTVEDAMARQMDMIMFFKNMALLGSALMYAAIPEPWAYSLSKHQIGKARS